MEAIEIVAFQAGSDIETLKAARARALDAVRTTCPGFIDARLYEGEGQGNWIDVVRWASLAEAKAAAEVSATLPGTQEFFSFITAPPSMMHGTLVEGP